MADNSHIDIARTYINTPFHHQGRQKGVGVDCAGLIVCVAREQGHHIVDYLNYPRQSYNGLLEKYFNANFERIPSIEPGCILLIRMVEHPNHTAIYTGASMIHCRYRPGGGKVVEHEYNTPWPSLTAGYYRWPV